MSFCNQCGTELADGAKFCANCGTAVAGGGGGMAEPAATVRQPASPAEPFRPGATQPVVSPSGGGLGWVLPVLVLVAVVIVGYLLLAPKGSVPAADTRKAAVASDAGTRQETASGRRAVDEASDAATMAGADARTGSSVSAAVLDSAFNSDPAGAAARYAGPIRVSGTIASMVQPGATPSLSMEGRTRFNFMVVEFPEGYRTRLAPLAKGQFISVACDQVRGLGGTTILSGCLLT
ncbi:zinc-ribbon domain-containing protein [Sphingomonas sp. RP10(2022)]|uniref:Zinc-ribbon domain-containing protein n=1 Tax=Sphingomonas liriopis TaxID=2949094 RepID=A0A9X2HQ95_9SPHN|nr:zinc-ribbon domain-containing protein [Sphingomonas liriopis]MCP3733454.1 zinc-ribbon domain-containing protein [Sphingomonas liriopis]